MNRFRRYFRIAWVAQLAFVVLALPAAHVHRHAPGESCGGSCSTAAHDHASCDSHDHDHGSACSHGQSSCSHSHAGGQDREVARVAGERTLEKPGASHEHCAACELQRLIGQGFAPPPTAICVVSTVETAPCFVATCFGREVPSCGCRGPPVAC